MSFYAKTCRHVDALCSTRAAYGRINARIESNGIKNAPSRALAKPDIFSPEAVVIHVTVMPIDPDQRWLYSIDWK